MGCVSRTIWPRSCARPGTPARARRRSSKRESPASPAIDVPFAYYARLSRSQQAVYRKSDAIVEIRLEDPAALHASVAALDAALRTEERVATERASRELVAGLADAMGLPAVRVEVLAARPHSRWGELPGLHTHERSRPPKIQRWMPPANQQRVGALPTYHRTLLSE